ncbi:MAG: NAD(P)/FAD-dependent oxidoreductase [Thermomicrobiales bacterium]
MTRQIVIVGAGIVGTAIAAGLSAIDGITVTVIEQGPPERLPGSTGHAPGFVGVLGDSPVLTGLAKASAAAYDTLRVNGVNGFSRVGSIEIATTAQAERLLEQRYRMAQEAGLASRLIEPEEAITLAPSLIDPAPVRRGLHFPTDGTARASIITTALRARSEDLGARYINSQLVTGFGFTGDRVASVQTSDTSIAADDIVIAAGIWSPLIAEMAGFRLSLVPVEHPYIYGPPRARNQPPHTATAMPFIRWPEHHVYARDHGARFGLGTYDHEPSPIAPTQLGASAERPWPGHIFDDAIDRARHLLPEANRFDPALRLNGLFAMTPDNLPFLGPLPDMHGVWVAVAIWITHAVGAANALVGLMTEGGTGIDGVASLHPDRFAGQDHSGLERLALRLYRDIYATDAVREQ